MANEGFTVTDENYRQMTNDDVEGAFASFSYDHDRVAAQNLIRYFYLALRDGNLFATSSNPSKKERVFLRFIESAFGRYVDGKSLDTAFGLKKPAGRSPAPSKDDRDLAIAAKVEVLVREEMRKRGIKGYRQVMKRFKSGKGTLISTVKMEPIYQEAAVDSDVEWKSVEKIYADYEDGVRALDTVALAALTGHLDK